MYYLFVIAVHFISCVCHIVIMSTLKEYVGVECIQTINLFSCNFSGVKRLQSKENTFRIGLGNRITLYIKCILYFLPQDWAYYNY